jgi:hypothetical protein
VIVPRRVDGSWLAATRNAMVPSPCPLLPEVMLIQDAPLAADHEQSRATLTASVPLPPAAAKLDGGFATDAWHRALEALEGAVALVTPELPHPIAASAVAVANSRARNRVFTVMHVSSLGPATMGA